MTHRIISFISLALLIFFYANVSYSADTGNRYPVCYQDYKNMNRYHDLWDNAEYYSDKRTSYYDKYSKYYDRYSDCADKEYDKFKKYFDLGYEASEYGNYKEAVDNYELALKTYPSESATLNNLTLNYYKLANGSLDKELYDDAIKYYGLAESYGYSDKYAIYFNMGVTYYKLGDSKDALDYYNKALDITFDEDRIKEVNDRIELVNFVVDYSNDIKEAKDNAPSNDTYAYKQYYINELNIGGAYKKVTNGKKVVVAVVDDGVNINHPDLTNNIWINSNEIPGNGKDDDNNGYVDDFNGWNFVYNNNNLIPLGNHGTMVAGIIGAESNNKEGIMGIANNVKLMPIGVCGLESCDIDNITKGIKYAVDNGADIINLSLGGHQFAGYNIKYDEALEYANNKGVIIIAAAGNGDVLSNEEEGVNTSVNKISPICNYSDNVSNIIGVGSFDKEGYRVRWSNYGSCVDYYAPGVDIFSTSILEEDADINNYAYKSGTSFSTPIITGIVALGYNAHGKASNAIIWDSLYKSLVPNAAGNHNIDASKYLLALGNNLELNIIVNGFFMKLDRKFARYSEYKQNQTYEKYIEVLTKYGDKLKEGKKKDLINILIFGMQERLNK